MKAILTKVTLGFLITAFLLILYVFLFVLETPWHRSHTPPLDSGSLWVSSNPDIWFVWDDDALGALGEIEYNGEIIEVQMLWGLGPFFEIHRYPAKGSDSILVQGSCKFSQDKGMVYVDKDIAGILDGVKTITFVRQNRGTE